MPTPVYTARFRPLPERFWARVDKDGPVIRPDLGACWLWTGPDNGRGYGQVYAPELGRWTAYAHRVAWTLGNGAIPPKMDVCHHCDTRRCCRPDHLFLGTRAQNMQDMIAKRRNYHVTRPDAILRGSRHGNARLTESDVQRIRETALLRTKNARAIAAEFSVHIDTIHDIAQGRSWKHVGFPPYDCH